MQQRNGYSILGYGCMRFTRNGNTIDFDKAEKEFMRAYELGVNYFDTAYIYPGSEELASLLAMTPHSRRMSHSLREQAASLEGMDVTVNYIIRVLKKK